MDDHLKRKKYPTAILKSSMLLKQQIQKLKVLFNGESQPQRLWNTFYFLKYWQKKFSIKKGNLYLHCYQAKTCSFTLLFSLSYVHLHFSPLSLSR